MLHDPVDHVGDGLESAVGMPRRALWSAGAIFHFAHLVEMDEGIKQGEIHPGEGPLHRETRPKPQVRSSPTPLTARRRSGGSAIRGRMRMSSAVTVFGCPHQPPRRRPFPRTCESRRTAGDRRWITFSRFRRLEWEGPERAIPYSRIVGVRWPRRAENRLTTGGRRMGRQRTWRRSWCWL